MKTPQKKAAAEPKVIATATTTRMRPTPRRAIGTRFSITGSGKVMCGALTDGNLRPGDLGCFMVGAEGGEGVAAEGSVDACGAFAAGAAGAKGIEGACGGGVLWAAGVEGGWACGGVGEV